MLRTICLIKVNLVLQTDLQTDRPTDRLTDRPRYRSDLPSLKNIFLTAPYGQLTTNFEELEGRKLVPEEFMVILCNITVIDIEGDTGK